MIANEMTSQLEPQSQPEVFSYNSSFLGKAVNAQQQSYEGGGEIGPTTSYYSTISKQQQQQQRNANRSSSNGAAYYGSTVIGMTAPSTMKDEERDDFGYNDNNNNNVTNDNDDEMMLSATTSGGALSVLSDDELEIIAPPRRLVKRTSLGTPSTSVGSGGNVHSTNGNSTAQPPPHETASITKSTNAVPITPTVSNPILSAFLPSWANTTTTTAVASQQQQQQQQQQQLVEKNLIMDDNVSMMNGGSTTGSSRMNNVNHNNATVSRDEKKELDVLVDNAKKLLEHHAKMVRESEEEVRRMNHHPTNANANTNASVTGTTVVDLEQRDGPLITTPDDDPSVTASYSYAEKKFLSLFTSPSGNQGQQQVQQSKSKSSLRSNAKSSSSTKSRYNHNNKEKEDDNNVMMVRTSALHSPSASYVKEFSPSQLDLYNGKYKELFSSKVANGSGGGGGESGGGSGGESGGDPFGIRNSRSVVSTSGGHGNRSTSTSKKGSMVNHNNPSPSPRVEAAAFSSTKTTTPPPRLQPPLPPVTVVDYKFMEQIEVFGRIERNQMTSSPSRSTTNNLSLLVDDDDNEKQSLCDEYTVTSPLGGADLIIPILPNRTNSHTIGNHNNTTNNKNQTIPFNQTTYSNLTNPTCFDNQMDTKVRSHLSAQMSDKTDEIMTMKQQQQHQTELEKTTEHTPKAKNNNKSNTTTTTTTTTTTKKKKKKVKELDPLVVVGQVSSKEKNMDSHSTTIGSAIIGGLGTSNEKGIVTTKPSNSINTTTTTNNNNQILSKGLSFVKNSFSYTNNNNNNNNSSSPRETNDHGTKEIKNQLSNTTMKSTLSKSQRAATPTSATPRGAIVVPPSPKPKNNNNTPSRSLSPFRFFGGDMSHNGTEQPSIAKRDVTSLSQKGNNDVPQPLRSEKGIIIDTTTLGENNGNQQQILIDGNNETTKKEKVKSSKKKSKSKTKTKKIEVTQGGSNNTNHNPTTDEKELSQTPPTNNDIVKTNVEVNDPVEEEDVEPTAPTVILPPVIVRINSLVSKASMQSMKSGGGDKISVMKSKSFTEKVIETTTTDVKKEETELKDRSSTLKPNVVLPSSIVPTTTDNMSKKDGKQTSIKEEPKRTTNLPDIIIQEGNVARLKEKFSPKDRSPDSKHGIEKNFSKDLMKYNETVAAVDNSVIEQQPTEQVIIVPTIVPSIINDVSPTIEPTEEPKEKEIVVYNDFTTFITESVGSFIEEDSAKVTVIDEGRDQIEVVDFVALQMDEEIEPPPCLVEDSSVINNTPTINKRSDEQEMSDLFTDLPDFVGGERTVVGLTSTGGDLNTTHKKRRGIVSRFKQSFGRKKSPLRRSFFPTPAGGGMNYSNLSIEDERIRSLSLDNSITIPKGGVQSFGSYNTVMSPRTKNLINETVQQRSVSTGASVASTGGSGIAAPLGPIPTTPTATEYIAIYKAQEGTEKIAFEDPNEIEPDDHGSLNGTILTAPLPNILSLDPSILSYRAALCIDEVQQTQHSILPDETVTLNGTILTTPPPDVLTTDPSTLSYRANLCIEEIQNQRTTLDHEVTNRDTASLSTRGSRRTTTKEKIPGNKRSNDETNPDNVSLSTRESRRKTTNEKLITGNNKNANGIEGHRVEQEIEVEKSATASKELQDELSLKSIVGIPAVLPQNSKKKGSGGSSYGSASREEIKVSDKSLELHKQMKNGIKSDGKNMSIQYFDHEKTQNSLPIMTTGLGRNPVGDYTSKVDKIHPSKDRVVVRNKVSESQQQDKQVIGGSIGGREIIHKQEENKTKTFEQPKKDASGTKKGRSKSVPRVPIAHSAARNMSNEPSKEDLANLIFDHIVGGAKSSQRKTTGNVDGDVISPPKSNGTTDLSVPDNTMKRLFEPEPDRIERISAQNNSRSVNPAIVDNNKEVVTIVGKIQNPKDYLEYSETGNASPSKKGKGLFGFGGKGKKQRRPLKEGMPVPILRDDNTASSGRVSWKSFGDDDTASLGDVSLQQKMRVDATSDEDIRTEAEQDEYVTTSFVQELLAPRERIRLEDVEREAGFPDELRSRTSFLKNGTPVPYSKSRSLRNDDSSHLCTSVPKVISHISRPNARGDVPDDDVSEATSPTFVKEAPVKVPISNGRSSNKVATRQSSRSSSAPKPKNAITKHGGTRNEDSKFDSSRVPRSSSKLTHQSVGGNSRRQQLPPLSKSRQSTRADTSIGGGSKFSNNKSSVVPRSKPFQVIEEYSSSSYRSNDEDYSSFDGSDPYESNWGWNIGSGWFW